MATANHTPALAILHAESEIDAYLAFLRAKMALAPHTGLEVMPEEVHPLLKPHQRDAVIWAVNGGRRALFESFGLGKTLQQLEICRLITQHVGGKALIVCPLGVRQEFARDAAMIGLRTTFIRSPQDLEHAERQVSFLSDPLAPIYLTNYESIRAGKLDPTGFAVVSLDEAAVLRGFGSTLTFRTMMQRFEGTSTYRFVATAVPDPNEFIELLAYAAFLGIMDVGEAKTRFFKRDSQNADKLTLHTHKAKEFWLWVSSWALFLQRPSDLGYPDDGYILPPMTIRWHEVPTDHSTALPERDGQCRMFKEAAQSLPEAAREKRESLETRIATMLEIVKESPQEHFVLWHDLEDERRAIMATLPEATAVYGTQQLDEREQRILDFADGKLQYLAGKPSMLGAGVNLQRHCHRAIYVGIGFKFHDLIQSLHRLHRFLQTAPVTVDLIYTEAERSIRRTLEEKWARYIEQAAHMSRLIREHGLATAALARGLHRTISIERQEAAGERYRLINNDCILETRIMPANSVDLIITSIPFSTQYEYTPSYHDLGHTEDNAHFWAQMDFLTPELLRVLRPGRVAAIHVKDRVTPGGVNGLGFQTVTRFSDQCADHFEQHGFAFLARKTIVTDVVRENNQTYRLGWTEQCKDGSRMGCGLPEYVLLFRKSPTEASNGYADVPVIKEKPLTEIVPQSEGEEQGFWASEPDRPVHEKVWIPYDYDAGKIVPGTGYSRAKWQLDAHGFTRSSGNRLLTPDELRHLPHEQIYKRWRAESLSAVYDFERHVEVGELLEREKRLPSSFMLLPPHTNHPDVWTDIARMRTLNMEQERRGQELHLCCLQLDIVERLITQFSMKEEIIFDPFAGICTVPYLAIKMGRRGIGIELNARYFHDGTTYCREAEAQCNVPTLFDLEALATQEPPLCP